MIPKRYRDNSNRMRWSYVWDRDGQTRPQILKMGFNPGTSAPHDLIRLLDHLFPNKVVPSFSIDVFDDRPQAKIIDGWIRENIKGAWQLWMTSGDMRMPIYYFENESDALLFKLRWS